MAAFRNGIAQKSASASQECRWREEFIGPETEFLNLKIEARAGFRGSAPFYHLSLITPPNVIDVDRRRMQRVRAARKPVAAGDEIALIRNPAAR